MAKGLLASCVHSFSSQMFPLAIQLVLVSFQLLSILKLIDVMQHLCQYSIWLFLIIWNTQYSNFCGFMNVNLGYKAVNFSLLQLFSAIGGKELLIWVQMNHLKQPGICINYSFQAMCCKELQLNNVTEVNGLT